MVREELEKIHGVRAEFRGEVAKFGTKPTWKGPPIQTMLLRNVCDAGGKIVTDHLWFTVYKTLAELNLEVGDEIVFEARVADYVKGYRGHREDYDLPPVETDYKLSHPTRARKIDKTAKQVKLL